MSSSPNPPIPPADRNKPAKGGMGGVVTVVLAIICVVLAIIAITTYSAKGQLEKDLASAKEETKKSKDDVETTTKKVNQLAADMQTNYMRIATLPPDLQGKPFEAAQKIQKLYDESKNGGASQSPVVGSGPGSTPGSSGVPGSNGPRPPSGANDPASVQIENVARAVLKQAFDTKAATNGDPTKDQMHKSIQIVLARIGAFNKPVTGNQKDTMDAVMAFQKANGLKPDGIVGKGTWGKVREKFNALPKS